MQNIYKEKNSKFIGFLIKTSPENIKKEIQKITKKYKKINHICYAYYDDESKIYYNDNEVGNIGNDFLNILEKNNIKNRLLLSIRIYGGIKLGIGPLKRAYKKSIINLITNNQ